MINEQLQGLARPITWFKLDPKNARMHDERNLESIAMSLAEFGQQKPVVAMEDGTLVAGNGTFTAAKELLAWDELAAVVFTDEVKARAYALAYFVGEFVNSFVLAKMKVMTSGRHLWTRTIGSTVVGEFVDTLIFFPFAFYGVFSDDLLVRVIIMNYAVKVSWEILITPITYVAVAWLKRAEGVDHYDTKTNFTPFTLGS